MKKNLFIIILTLFLFSSLSAEQYYKGIDILPDKLIKNELPEDYHKELNELFKLGFDVFEKAVEVHPKIDEVAERTRFIKEYIRNLPKDRYLYVGYLVWLANNTIPKYYEEYTTIIQNKELFNIKNKKDYYKKYLRITAAPYLSSIIGYLKSSTLMKEDNAISKYEKLKLLKQPIWVKAKVVKSEFVDSRSVWYNPVELEILEPFGDKFKKNKLFILNTDSRLIRPKIEKDKFILKKNIVYIIPIGTNIIDSSYEIFGNSDSFTYFGYTITNNDVVFDSYRDLIIPLDDSNISKNDVFSEHFQKWLFDKNESSITYNEIKDTIENLIYLMKSSKNFGGYNE